MTNGKPALGLETSTGETHNVNQPTEQQKKITKKVTGIKKEKIMKNESETNETIERNMSEHLTDYATAINWCGNHYVLLNEITEIDPDLSFNWGKSAEDFNDEQGDFYEEIFQFFLSDMSDADARFLRKTFDVLIAYSTKLNKYILCVTHYGTSWRITPCKVKDDEFWARNGKDIVLKF